MKKIIAMLLTAAAFSACTNTDKKNTNPLPDTIKIVSLNGTVSEIIAGIGLEKSIIGTDVTSNYPESLKSKPKVGHNRNINAEGILALQPNTIVGLEKEVSPQLVTQFKAAGIKLILFKQDFSIPGTRDLIHAVGDSLKYQKKADSLIRLFDAEVAAAQKQVKITEIKPKVLFIYARGSGTMMVGGAGTQVEKIIELAGGKNAVTGFADYKPLTSEALVNANPDVILLFDDGLESLGGIEGLLKVQGIGQTNAGKNKKVITMDGSLLTSFGPRLGQAITELSNKLK